MELMTANHDGFLPTRRSLLMRIKDPDDRVSWQEFFDMYSGLILAVSIRAGLSQSEAQEVLQETMIAVCKKIPDFEYDPNKGRFKGWLLKLTRWRIDDQFRKRPVNVRGSTETSSRTGKTSVVARIPDPRGCDLEAIWDEEWRQNLFRAAVERVKRTANATQYQIFDLYVLKQWPPEKVARMLDIKVGRVFVAKHRILELVKKEISRLENETF
jgi:RNA polymerase sigma-70 factor (ECF subfamily)